MLVAMLRSVAVIVLPGATPFELGVVSEIFRADRADAGAPTFELRVCTPVPGVVRGSGGFDLVVPLGLEAAADADLVVVPPYRASAEPGGLDLHATRVPTEVLDVVRAAHARGAWVLSVCSGAFVLGRAGLLDGRRCTAHWIDTDELVAQFPLAQVDRDVLYVDDDRVITSAGTASGIDACLHLVRREFGAAAAGVIARRMIVAPHRDGGQAQYVDTPLPCEPDALGGLLAWMGEHLDAELTVAQLAERAMLSPRTFARRFRAETGTTPAAWLIRMRVARAQELLERTDVPIDEVARLSGFGSPAGLRHHFSRVLRTSPQVYRRTFCSLHLNEVPNGGLDVVSGAATGAVAISG